MVANKKGKKKWIWITAGIAAVILLAVLLLNSIAAPFIGRKIATGVRRASSGGYTLKFSDIKVNVFTGRLVLRSVKLLADTAMLRQKPYRITGSAGTVEFTGIKVFDYWWHKKLEIGMLKVESVALDLEKRRKDTARAKASETLYEKLSGSLKLLSAKKILLDNISLNYRNAGDRPVRVHLPQASLEASDLLIDSATQADTSRVLYCREIIAGIDNFSGTGDDGAYHYMLRHARYSTLTRHLWARGISVKPLEVRQFFAKKHTDRFDFKLDSLSLEAFDYQNYLENNAFHAGKIFAARGRLNIFGDPSGKTTPGDRVAGFPNFVLRKIKTQLVADTIDLSEIDVSYTELNKKDGKTGTVEFAGTRGRLTRITNRPDSLARDPWSTVKLVTRFMRAGALKVDARFDQADKACSFLIRGELGEMQAAVINPLAMPLGLARVKSGRIRRLTFDIRGNRYENAGVLGLLYQDVELEMLTDDYHNRVMKTILANTMAIAPNNPDDQGGTPRASQLDYRRPVNVPFFCALWRTLSAGIKACIEERKSAAADPTPRQSLVKKILTAPVRLFKKKS